MENLRGIAWMVAAMALFAVEDALIKAAVATVPLGQIMLSIGLGGSVVFVALARARGIRLIDPVVLSRPVLIRNASEIVGTIGIVTAIATVPLATAITILQASPLLITLGAAVIFREPVGWRRWSAIAVGFAGVLVIVRPGAQAFDPLVLFAIVGTLGLAGRDLASRAVPRSVSSLQLAVYGFAMLVPTGLILMPFTGGAAMPSAAAWLLIVGAVVCGVAAYYAITEATRTGDVAVVTPFRYSRLPFAILLGILFFGEVPDSATYAGAALIVGSGLFTLWRETRLMRSAPISPPL
jgi:drug/metabolite transporter (DMT)-like permease